MTWLRLDVDFPENKKLTGVPVQARWLYLAALCYCARNLTDGHVDPRAVKVLGAVCDLAPARWVIALVQARLWREDDHGDGYWINDYHDYQPSAEYMKERAAKRSAAARLAAQARWHASTDAATHAGTDALSDAVFMPHNETRQYEARAVAPLSETQSPPSYEGGRDFTTLGKLKHACRAHVGSSDKLDRAAKGCSEADVVAALEACKGPGVRDRLAVALAELKRRKETAA